MMAELEAKEVSHGSMDSLRTDLPTEATREKEEEAQRLQRLEEAMREAQERKKNLEARMQEKIRRQVQIAVSASKQASEPRINH